MKGRTIFLFIKGSRKFFIGTSATQMAKRCGMYGGTIRKACVKAEEKEDHIFENSRYMVCVTDDFVRGLSRGGGFSY